MNESGELVWKPALFAMQGINDEETKMAQVMANVPASMHAAAL
jgi:hypothetical protein